MTHGDGHTDDTLHLSEWLEEQKQRANDRIADDRVSDEETWRWKGERDLIDSLQSYLEMGTLDTDSGCVDGVEQHDRSASFDAGIKLAGLATELGYKVGEYEIVGADVDGEEIVVHFRDVDTGGDSV